jgi:hypothetical protein
MSGMSATMAALGVTVLMSACDGVSQSPSAPASPPTRPPTTVAKFTLSGVVFEVTPAGKTPVDGVLIYCDTCGPVGHSDRTTDATGAYSFEEVANGRTTLVLGSKLGYNLSRQDEPEPTGWMGGVYATVSGDTRFDIQLVRQ